MATARLLTADDYGPIVLVGSVDPYAIPYIDSNTVEPAIPDGGGYVQGGMIITEYAPPPLPPPTDEGYIVGGDMIVEYAPPPQLPPTDAGYTVGGSIITEYAPNTSLPTTLQGGTTLGTTSFEGALIASQDMRVDNLRRLASTYGVTDPVRVLQALQAAYVAWGTPPANVNVEADAQNVLYALGLPGGSTGWSMCNTTKEAMDLLARAGITFNYATNSAPCRTEGGSGFGILSVGVTSGGTITGNVEDVSIGAGSVYSPEQIKAAQDAFTVYANTLPVNTSLPASVPPAGTVPTNTDAPTSTATTQGGSGGTSLPISTTTPKPTGTTVQSGQTNPLVWVAGVLALLVLAEVLR